MQTVYCIKKGGDFKCRNCSEGGMKVVDEARQFVLGAREELEVVEKFCYLGDVIWERGWCGGGIKID